MGTQESPLTTFWELHYSKDPRSSDALEFVLQSLSLGSITESNYTKKFKNVFHRSPAWRSATEANVEDEI